MEMWKKARTNLENDAKLHLDIATQLKEDIVGSIATYINENESKMVIINKFMIVFFFGKKFIESLILETKKFQIQLYNEGKIELDEIKRRWFQLQKVNLFHFNLAKFLAK